MKRPRRGCHRISAGPLLVAGVSGCCGCGSLGGLASAYLRPLPMLAQTTLQCRRNSAMQSFGVVTHWVECGKRAALRKEARCPRGERALRASPFRTGRPAQRRVVGQVGTPGPKERRLGRKQPHGSAAASVPLTAVSCSILSAVGRCRNIRAISRVPLDIHQPLDTSVEEAVPCLIGSRDQVKEEESAHRGAVVRHLAESTAPTQCALTGRREMDAEPNSMRPWVGREKR
jgi:hypothetical protein